MSGFDATSAGLQAAASQLHGVVDDLDAEFALLKGRVDGLLDAGWTGGAAKGFGAGWNEWLEGYKMTTGALSKMSALLRDTALDYDASDGGATERFMNVQAELP